MESNSVYELLRSYENRIERLEKELKVAKAAAARGGLTEEDLEIMAKEYEFHYQEQTNEGGNNE